MLERCLASAKTAHLSQHISTLQADFNQWETDLSFDIILANQCLHHVVNLEHLFETVFASLTIEGVFLVSDMIGRNGHMRWSEAMDLLNPIWNDLPERLKYNQLMRRYEPSFINHDCSTSGFEGIRAQDILTLLVNRFNFDLFIPFANIIMVLIDRPFGHNFDVLKPEDTLIIDQVHEIDHNHMLNGLIKPTQMVAALSKQKRVTQLSHPKMTPTFCIRRT